MSRVLLDTSGYSAFMRGDGAVKEILQTVEAIYLSAVGEVVPTVCEFGLRSVPNRNER